MLGIVLKHSIVKESLIRVRLFQGIIQNYDKNIFGTLLCSRAFLTRSIRSIDRLAQPAKFLKPNRWLVNLSVQCQQTIHLDINTNVCNNVILYKNENHRYFRNLHFFAIGQLLGWSILAIYTYTPSFFDIFNTDIELKEYMKKNIIRLSTFVFSAIVGPLLYYVIYLLCARTVKFIILNKGGKTITFSTYHLLKKADMIVPTNKIKTVSHRTDKGAYVPLKLQDKSFYYLMDKQGMFVNPELFDHTVGVAQF